MKVNACLISLILIAIVAVLLLLNQPKWVNKSRYSDKEGYGETYAENAMGETYAETYAEQAMGMENYAENAMGMNEMYAENAMGMESYAENAMGMESYQENCGCGM